MRKFSKSLPQGIYDRALTSTVATVDHLNRSVLQQYFSGQYLAVRVPNFYSPEACGVAVNRLLTHKSKESYAVTTSKSRTRPIYKIGKAIFESLSSPSKLAEYYDNVDVFLKEMRKVFAPNLTPIDKLKLLFLDVWLHGCESEKFHDKEMFFGLVRIFEENSEAKPHQDNPEWELPGSIKAKSLYSNNAVNIYLKVPQAGGELELWDYAITDETQHRNMIEESSYGLDRRKIGASAVILKPRVGDLIMFNSGNIHAVKPSIGGSRVTSSCFVGYRGNNKPLSVFS